MWIEEINGHFRAVERYKDPVTGKTRKVSVSMEKNTAKSRKAAERMLILKIEEKMNTVDYHSITLKEMTDGFVEHQSASVKPSTARRDRAAAKQVLLILGEDSMVSRINARYVYNCLSGFTDQTTTYNNSMRRIKQIFKWGYSHDYVQDIQWLDKLTPRKDKASKEKQKVKFMESDELNRFVSELSVDRWRNLTLFLALTGMRVGEALALDYKDINLKDRTISISKTLDITTEEIHSPKTYDSNREIYIQDELLPLCKTLRASASANRFFSDLVFWDCKYNTYNLYLKENSQRILGRSITPHVLRHTHVALLAEQGMSLDLISRRLGHGDSKITKDVYFHVTSKLKEQDYQCLKEVKIL